MLADYLEGRGFSVALLNGSMDLDARTQAQQAFSQDAQILISTDAGGEGLNLQFCHVVVNFDMPWNPMRIEQRIGRVDRIGQQHVVRATNFVLEETVEYRVRQVLEEKLTVIAKEFGVDKAADVMDSVEAEPWFDELFVQGLTDPESIDQECDAVVSQIREKVAESRQGQRAARRGDVRRAAVLSGRGPQVAGSSGAVLAGAHDHHRTPRPRRRGCPGWGSLAHPLAGRQRVGAGLLRCPHCRRPAGAGMDHAGRPARPRTDRELPRCVAGQPIPRVRISGLPETVAGVWSLWEISPVRRCLQPQALPAGLRQR